MRGGEGSSGDWDVRDVDVPPTRLRTEQVLGLVSQGRLGLRSQVRRAGESAWAYATDRPAFGYAFPHLNLLRVNPTTGSAVGVGAVNPDPTRALDVARTVASDPASANLGFWFAAHVPQAATPVVRSTHLFRMWHGFYVGPIVESRIVKPGGRLNVHMAAFNATDEPQRHTVVADQTDGMAISEWDISFALAPWKWTVQRASIPTDPKPGWHQIGFHSVAPSTRGATAVAVGLMTLGSLVYVPGSEGFSLQYGVLSPDNADTATAWEAKIMDAAARRFTERGADTITTAKGYRVPEEVVLQWFGMYLTPERVVAELDDKEREPEEKMRRLFDAFLFDAYGVEDPQKAFPTTGSDPSGGVPPPPDPVPQG